MSCPINFSPPEKQRHAFHGLLFLHTSNIHSFLMMFAEEPVHIIVLIHYVNNNNLDAIFHLRGLNQKAENVSRLAPGVLVQKTLRFRTLQ